MKRPLLSFCFVLLTMVTASAQLTFTRSGSYDMLIRLAEPHRYLLLPIEEAAPEYRVQVIEQGKILRTLTLRLAAKNKIDYYVPFDMEGLDTEALVLAVHIWNQPQSPALHEPSPMDYIAWDSIQATDEYTFVNTEKQYRPQFHHTPQWGWMNDPNGMFYDASTGLYHLYYQHNPYCSLWQNMSWGHSTSSDLIHWTPCPEAILPTTLGTIFSGSAVIDTHNTAGFGENAVVAIYTAAELMGQSQALAYSTDGGRTFTQYAGNPILTSTIPDFRDPKVFRDEQDSAWCMVLACGQEMRFYRSSNLREWSYMSSFGSDYGNHEGVWECPDLVCVKERETGKSHWVLICNINPGGPFGGSATQYFVGNWDGHTFTPLQENGQVPTKWMDCGKDHYAAVSFAHTPDHRPILLAWMSNWQYANQVPTMQYRSANSLPREIDLFTDKEGILRIGVRPAAEVQALRGQKVKTLPQTAIVEIDIQRGDRPAQITLSNDLGEQVVMNYDFQAGTFSMNRHKSGKVSFSDAFPTTTVTPLFAEATRYHLTLYIDRSSIEAFDGDGHWAMTNLVFPTKPYNRIKVSGGKSAIYSIKN